MVFKIQKQLLKTLCVHRKYLKYGYLWYLHFNIFHFVLGDAHSVFYFKGKTTVEIFQFKNRYKLNFSFIRYVFRLYCG